MSSGHVDIDIVMKVASLIFIKFLKFLFVICLTTTKYIVHTGVPYCIEI